MDIIFDICVQLLIVIGYVTGIGYKAANILIFVIIHPALTLYFYYKMKKYKKLLVLNNKY